MDTTTEYDLSDENIERAIRVAETLTPTEVRMIRLGLLISISHSKETKGTEKEKENLLRGITEASPAILLGFLHALS
jgi:hypothetical protein